MNALQADGFELLTYRNESAEHDVYAKGAGRSVVLLHELPGLAPPTVRLANRLVAEGFRVYLPHLFGPLLTEASGRNLVRLCISREFAYLRAGVEAPVTRWLRALVGWVSERSDSTGVDSSRHVAVIGMCLTGGFIIPLVIEPCVKVAVAAQPAIPFSTIYKLTGRGAGPWMGQLNVPDHQLVEAAARARADEIPIMALRFKADRICVHEKIARLCSEFGPQLQPHELDDIPRSGQPGHPHATLTYEYDAGNGGALQAYALVVQFLKHHL